MKSIISGNLVEMKTKQRQNNATETSQTDPLARRPNRSRPTSSQKHPEPQRRGSEVRDTEACSSDQVLDLSIPPIANSIPLFEEQRRDINRIMAGVSILQQDVSSLWEHFERFEGRRDHASHDLVREVGIPTDNTTKASSRPSELHALKLEMKIMQQCIKRMEESRPEEWRSSTILGSAQMSRRPSPTIDEQVISRKDAPSNGSLFPSTPAPMAAYFDSLFVPRKTSHEGQYVVDRDASLSQGLQLGSNAEVLPIQKPFTARPRTRINGTASRGSHTPVDMPPPQLHRKGPEQNVAWRRSSTVSNVATPRTASTSFTGTTNSATFPRSITQMHKAFPGSHHSHQDDHTYDDELVDDVRPYSLTRSSTRNSRQPRTKTAHSRQNLPNESPQPTPSKIQRRQNLQMPPLNPGPSSENRFARGRNPRHDSKRRKTNASDASTSIWAANPRESRSSSARRDELDVQVRVDVDVDVGGRSARVPNLEGKGRKRPGERDGDGYLLRPDGTRDPLSVKNIDQWRKRKAEAKLPG